MFGECDSVRLSSQPTVYPLLLITLAPLALFTVLWWFGRPENSSVSSAERYRMTVIAGWAFLLVPLLLPLPFNQIHRFLQDFAGAVCATCTFGFALLAIRLAGRVRVSPALLLATSLTWMVYSLWYYTTRLADLKQP